MQQVVDFVPSLPTLDAPVPQMVEQLPDILPFFAPLSPVPEQVIDVPKIVHEDVSLFTSVREPQPAGQLGEVPSIVSLSEVIRQPVEQTVDIPVGAGGTSGSGGLQGFLPGQSCSFTAEQIVDNPVPRRGLGAVCT